MKKIKFFINFKEKAILILFSILFTLFLIEICLRIFYPINLQSWYAEKVLIEKNFYVLRKNYEHKIDRWNWKYFAKYTFGEYRNRVTQPLNNQGDKILILGDSFTFGLYLKDNDTYMNKLQNQFSQYNLINSSVPGWSLEDYYLFTKNYCKTINPKQIIVILNDGDLARIRQPVIRKSSKSLKERYFVYRVLIENVMIAAFLRDNIYEIKKIFTGEKKFSFKKPIQITEGTAIEFDKNTSLEIVNDAEKIFIDLKFVSNECNAALNIINLGWTKEKNEDDILNDPGQLFIKINKHFFRNNFINFYNNSSLLKDVHFNKEKFIIKNEGHPNELGAEKIFKSLSVHFNKILK